MLTDGRTDDGRTTDAGVIGILIAHLGAFGSGELTRVQFENLVFVIMSTRENISLIPRASLKQSCQNDYFLSLFFK